MLKSVGVKKQQRKKEKTKKIFEMFLWNVDWMKSYKRGRKKCIPN